MKFYHENTFLLGDGWILYDFPETERALYLYRCPKALSRDLWGDGDKYIPPCEYVDGIKFAIFYCAVGSGKDDRKPAIIYRIDGKILFGYAYVY